ncbi:MAG: hypothetical protein ACREBW_09600 [Candidatus Micrarchaeaceae archaeon]
MKNFQSAVLQDPTSRRVDHLCNFHAWGLAAAQDAAIAAELFLGLLRDQYETFIGSPCEICHVLQEEEELRIREFVSCLGQKQVREWLRSEAGCCIAHGMRLKKAVPPVTAAAIGAILENHRKQLTEDLTRLLDEREHDHSRWGLLGQAAEFLVSQRGLHA